MLDAKIVPTELSDSFEYPLSCDASDELVIDEVDIAEFSRPKSLADRTCAESVNDFDHHGSSGPFVSVSGGTSCFASGASLIAECLTLGSRHTQVSNSVGEMCRADCGFPNSRLYMVS